MNKIQRETQLFAPTTLRPARISEAERLYSTLKNHFFWYSPVAKKGETRSIVDEHKARVGDTPQGYFAPFLFEEMERTINGGLTYVVEYASLLVSQGSLVPRGNGLFEIARVYTEPMLRGHGFMREVLGALELRATELDATEIRAVSQGTALDIFIANGYIPDRLPSNRIDTICNGCRIKDICPETALVKYL